jgi:hypothetical protein
MNVAWASRPSTSAERLEPPMLVRDAQATAPRICSSYLFSVVAEAVLLYADVPVALYATTR